MQGHGRAPDPALGAGDRDHRAADVFRDAREVVGLGALAHGLRPRRPAAVASASASTVMRRRQHVAEAGPHGLAQQIGRRLVRGEQQQPDRGVLGLQLARELEHRQRSELLVEDEHLDLGVGEHRDDVVAGLRRRDDLDLAGLLGQRDDLGGAIGVGEPERETRLHCSLRRRAGARRRQGVLALGVRQRAALVAAADQRQADLRREGLRVGQAQAERRAQGEGHRHQHLLFGRRLAHGAVVAAGTGGRAREPDGDDARAADDRAGAGRRARVVIGLEGGQHVDHVAGAQLARHAGVGVDEDRDLLLALLELRRLDEHPLLQLDAGGQRRVGHERADLGGVAQRLAADPLLRHGLQGQGVGRDRLQLGNRARQDEHGRLGLHVLAHIGDVARDEAEDEDRADPGDEEQQDAAALARGHTAIS